VFFAVAIIVLLYVPVLTLRSVEGKMFQPVVTTVLFVSGASLVIALTLMPALASLVFRNAQPGIAHDTWLMQKAHRLYEPLLRGALNFSESNRCARALHLPCP
jgi:cobalt-zinc-cadmium resistance protein CzcA